MQNEYLGERELVARKARTFFLEQATYVPLRPIDRLWTDEGFQPGPENPFTLETSDRRKRWAQYADAVDWTDHGQVRRALRVFWEAAQGLGDDNPCDAGMELLQRQGYTFDENGEPLGGPFSAALRADLLRGIKDPQVLLDHIGRIEAAASKDDPAQVVGSAKELVESTAKIVLLSRGVTIKDGKEDDLPTLIKQSQIALGVHSSVVASGADGEQSSRKILSGLAQAANGLNELRNVGGTGHGHAEARVALHARHAHLAASAARAWCEFMLATLADESAPWRKAL